MGHGNLLPGQVLELGEQAGLVALHGDQIVGTPAVEVPGVVTLIVQSVRCHHRTADVYAVQQRGEQGDLVGLGAHFYLAQHRAMGMVERSEQVRAVVACVGGAA
jgi:hypothetical protein